MKKLLGLLLILSAAAHSQSAWDGYDDDGYDNYGYSDAGYDDYDDYSYPDWRYSSTNSPKDEPNQYSRPTEQGLKRLEQQYDNLIIMFTKDECGYCRYMLPIMKKVEKKFGNEIKFVYVDVEDNSPYPKQYGFSTVPHIVYFKNGKKLDAHGSMDKTMTAEQVEEKIESLGMSKLPSPK